MRADLQQGTQANRFPSEWWGPVGANQIQLTLQELIENGSVTAEMCSQLSQVVATGRSLLVASRRSGAGKTTLLTALLERIDPSRRTVFVRGSYESFEFLQGESSTELALLVNEISPHLPVYCWGDSLRKLLSAHQAGYQVLSTIHADSAEEVRSLLLPFWTNAGETCNTTDLTVAFVSMEERADGVCRSVDSIVSVSLSTESRVGEKWHLRRQSELVVPATEPTFTAAGRSNSGHTR